MTQVKVKETPIIFQTDMVKAILDGKKTQTRRLLSAQVKMWKGKQPLDVVPMNVPNEWVGLMQREPNKGLVFKCRYGQVGDRLWVREAYCYESDSFAVKPRIRFKAGGLKDISTEDIPIGVPIYNYLSNDYPNCIKWKPSIHMFKKYARIWLEFTEVRVERLQEITREDALREGCPFEDLLHQKEPKFDLELKWFKDLWDSINAKRGSWDINPWVWVIGFKMYT